MNDIVEGMEDFGPSINGIQGVSYLSSRLSTLNSPDRIRDPIMLSARRRVFFVAGPKHPPVASRTAYLSDRAMAIPSPSLFLAGVVASGSQISRQSPPKLVLRVVSLLNFRRVSNFRYRDYDQLLFLFPLRLVPLHSRIIQISCPVNYLLLNIHLSNQDHQHHPYAQDRV
jgi:hypothetical protein